VPVFYVIFQSIENRWTGRKKSDDHHDESHNGKQLELPLKQPKAEGALVTAH
jgi:hypothetical protein